MYCFFQDLAEDEELPYNEKCAKIEHETCVIPSEQLIAIYAMPEYPYVVRDEQLPTFDDLRLTYVFRQMSEFDRQESLIKELAYVPQRSVYMRWATQVTSHYAQV